MMDLHCGLRKQETKANRSESRPCAVR